MADFRFILGRCVQQLPFQAIDIGVDAQAAAVFVFQTKVFLGIDKTQAVDIAHFLPLRVQGAVRIGAKQPVQAGLEGIIAPTPTGRQSAWAVMLFEKLDLVAAFSSVDRRAQPADAANDNDLATLTCHGGLVRLRS